MLLACEGQKLDVVRMLITAKPVGANVNLEAQDGRRPIWYIHYVLHSVLFYGFSWIGYGYIDYFLIHIVVISIQSDNAKIFW